MPTQLAKTLLIAACILGVFQGLICIIGGCIAAKDNYSDVSKNLKL
jgi:TRAP-type C4-dicarboxylate transport system permease small subunit